MNQTKTYLFFAAFLGVFLFLLHVFGVVFCDFAVNHQLVEAKWWDLWLWQFNGIYMLIRDGSMFAWNSKPWRGEPFERKEIRGISSEQIAEALGEKMGGVELSWIAVLKLTMYGGAWVPTQILQLSLHLSEKNLTGRTWVSIVFFYDPPVSG